MLNTTDIRTVHQIKNYFAAIVMVATMAFASAVNAQSTPSLTPLQKAIDTQRQRLNSSSEEERRDALLQLKVMRVPEASRAASTALIDPSPGVRAIAASAVLSMPPEESATSLLPLLTDKDEFVRRETAYALGHTKSRRATGPLIERLLTDKEESVKAAAVVALGEIGDETAVVPLSGVLTGSSKGSRTKNVFILRAAAEALGLIKSKAGAPALIVALTNDKFDSDIRREAAKALGRIKDPSAIPALQNASAASDPYLAATAYEAIRMINR